jgi:hypothetical protein
MYVTAKETIARSATFQAFLIYEVWPFKTNPNVIIFSKLSRMKKDVRTVSTMSRNLLRKLSGSSKGLSKVRQIVEVKIRKKMNGSKNL